MYVDLPAFQNTQCKFTKESLLNCHKKSFVFKFRFFNLFISIQVTEGKRLVTFNRNLHRSKFDVCFALVGTAASDSSAFFVRVRPNSC